MEHGPQILPKEDGQVAELVTGYLRDEGIRVLTDATASRSIAFRFHARDAHLVLSRAGREPIPFSVRLDGEAPGPSAGVDVDADGTGLLRDGRMYQLVRERDAVREQTLQITFLSPGAEAYAFTFG